MRLSDDCILREVGDGAVVLNERTGTYWHLNRSGAAIVAALIAGRSADGIAEEQRRRYPDTADAAAEDARALIAQLLDEELLRDE